MKKTPPLDQYLVSFVLETAGDHFFINKPTLKAIKFMVEDELDNTHLWNFGKLKVTKVKEKKNVE